MSKIVPGLLIIMLFITSGFYWTRHATATESSTPTSSLTRQAPVGQASSPEKVTWADLVNAQDRGNLLEKVSGADNWTDAGARSVQQLTADGYIEFTALEIDKERYFGLTNDYAGTEWNTIDYAIHLTSFQNGDTIAAIVLENGLYKTEIGYTPGTVFRISIENGKARYYANGNLFFSSTIKPVFPLTADVALRSINATIGNAVIDTSMAGPGNSADKKPPVIQGLTISNLTSNGVTIRYNTDEQAVTSVEYGPTSSYGNVLSQKNYHRNHQFNLVGLTAASTIHFRVHATDAAGNTAVSQDQTLTTLAASDTSPPIIFNSGVNNITSSGTTIFWSTDEPATSVIEYGQTSAYGSIVSLTSLQTTHTILLSRLQADSVIHFIIKSTDAAGNTAVSSDFTFVTLPDSPDTLPPIISGVMAQNISRTGATISWSTNELATSFVEYGTTTAYGSSIQLNTYRSRHGISISRLPSDTLIHFRVKSTDTGGNTEVSSDYVFKTLAEGDLTPPVLSAISATGITSFGATITWSTDELSTSVVEYGTTSAFGTIISDSSFVTGHSLNLTGLPADTIIFFRVKSTDGSGITATSAGSTFQTLPLPDSTPPVITGIGASGITSYGATITWSTDELSTSVVEYGTTSAFGTIISDSSLVTGHSLNLTGLPADTVIFFRVKSTDGSGNTAISAGSTFQTLPLPDSTPPVITGIGASGITSSGATITWSTDEPANSIVEYGLDPSLGHIVSINQLATIHSVTLIGLANNSLYYFRVNSVDAAGNMAISGNSVFTTLPAENGNPGITDYGTYPVPPPPALPPAGGTFVDPTFKTTLMRVTDDKDSSNNHNMYSYWPSFNKDSSYLWVGIANTAYLYDFDPVGFSLSNKRLFFRNKPSGISPFIEGHELEQPEQQSHFLP
ncbi:MAG: hypothetical protein IPM55_03140 [Acidobacteria bacterium]|nr:hypothetical protein [Acidobacteriota bacterium]